MLLFVICSITLNLYYSLYCSAMYSSCMPSHVFVYLYRLVYHLIKCVSPNYVFLLGDRYGMFSLHSSWAKSGRDCLAPGAQGNPVCFLHPLGWGGLGRQPSGIKGPSGPPSCCIPAWSVDVAIRALAVWWHMTQSHPSVWGRTCTTRHYARGLQGGW